MRTLLYSVLLSLACLIGLNSCSDHRLGGALSPARVRLKSVGDGTTALVYGYDSQNRVTSITRDGLTRTILYGDPQHLYTNSDTGSNHTFYVLPDLATPGDGYITKYPAVLDGTDFTAIQYRYYKQLGGKIYYDGRLRQISYTFDANRQINGLRDAGTSAQDISQYVFFFTNNNLTTTNLANGRSSGYKYINTYDDKINPQFGLLDPEQEPYVRFSRNNPVSVKRQYSTPTTPDGSFTTTVYMYEYNAQGLPIKRTAAIDGVPQTSVVTYVYEPY